MKVITFILSICFLCVSCSSVSYKWTKSDYALQTARLVVMGADWSQTRYIAAHRNEFREMNFLLGGHPNDGQVNSYFAGLAAGNLLVSYLLPSEVTINGIKYHPRRMFNVCGILGQGYAVASNAQLGVGFKF